MIRIKKIEIKRFRSIMNLELIIDLSGNFITICGENNSGKTNSLRALNLFFNPEEYVAQKDSPFHKFEGSQGAAVYPNITIEFDDDSGHIWKIERKFDKESSELVGTKDGQKIVSKDCVNFLKKVHFFFIPAINVDYPELINKAIDNVFEVAYAKSRFAGAKKKLKQAYEEYSSGLLEILGDLSNEINPLFKEYKENWAVNFSIDSDISKFRDLITDDIEFSINDSSNKYIDSKGSGLQRLAFILLHFKIIEKLKKNVILVVDEPDIFLHSALQKKLLSHFNQVTSKSQVFITTHSQAFIDTYSLKNVFLFELSITQTFFKRRNREFNVLNTILVDTNTPNGDQKVKSYLGIDNQDYDVLNSCNIMVEGSADAHYIQELAKKWQLEVPYIINLSGADNSIRSLEFYNNFYNGYNFKPTIKVLLDNDQKGRDVFKKINSRMSSFQNLTVIPQMMPNFLGNCSDQKNINNEMEDFIYPELIVELANKIFKKANLKPVKRQTICENIIQPAFESAGILQLLETYKNLENSSSGQRVIVNSENFKDNLSKTFRVKGDKKLIKILDECEKKYPKVKEFIEELLKFN